MGKPLTVDKQEIAGSTFQCSDLSQTHFVNCKMAGAVLEDVNFSDAVVKYAQFGGATFSFIGLGPDAPKDAKQRPVCFETFDLNSSTFRKGDLSNVQISECRTDGMRIDGVLVTDMIEAYKARQG